MADLSRRVMRRLGMNYIGLEIPGALGQWVDITPGGVTLGTFGFSSRPVMLDGTVYAALAAGGIYKTSDYGATWTGPIESGGGLIGIGLAVGTPPSTLYGCNISHDYGFWRSSNKGVNWTNINISPLPSDRQDVYQPEVDPYDPTHLLICAHENNYLVHSTNAGDTWSSITLDAGMITGGGTAWCFFIDTGVPSTTRTTWLWLAQSSSGAYGTWRTTNSGTNWTQVDTNEHPHGECQIYQPGNGVIFLAGVYSALGQGVLRSTDYGATWANVGVSNPASIVWGTPTSIWGAYGWASGGPVTPVLQTATPPGASGWSSTGDPAGMDRGPAGAVIITDSVRRGFITCNWASGIWRYVENI